jgi:putative ABC transport system substrate-binding protein
LQKRRREFIAGLCAAAWPLAARAQQQTKPTIVVFGGPRGRLEEIRRGLADVGFSECRDVTIDYRAVDGHLERLPALAADLVRQRPAAIVALSGVAAVAAKAATREIPTVASASRS